MLHTYDKQYSVYASSRYGILENFIIHYYNCYSTYYFVTSAFLYTSVCVAIMKDKIDTKKKKNQTEWTRYSWKTHSAWKDSYIYIFFFSSSILSWEQRLRVLSAAFFFLNNENRQMSLIKKLNFFFLSSTMKLDEREMRYAKGRFLNAI